MPRKTSIKKPTAKALLPKSEAPVEEPVDEAIEDAVELQPEVSTPIVSGGTLIPGIIQDAPEVIKEDKKGPVEQPEAKAGVFEVEVRVTGDTRVLKFDSSHARERAFANLSRTLCRNSSNTPQEYDGTMIVRALSLYIKEASSHKGDTFDLEVVDAGGSLKLKFAGKSERERAKSAIYSGVSQRRPVEVRSLQGRHVFIHCDLILDL